MRTCKKVKVTCFINASHVSLVNSQIPKQRNKAIGIQHTYPVRQQAL